jgi:hypothetical protein
VHVVVSRCPACDSTNRGPHRVRHILRSKGIENGHKFDTIIFRLCQCQDCGEWRQERSTELRGDAVDSRAGDVPQDGEIETRAEGMTDDWI